MEVKRLIIVAVGGQGNLLASRILGETALAEGVPVRMSEIHGMAQRGGVVESSLVFGDAESTIISDGEADVLVGFEPLETLRALKKLNGHGTVITNIEPLYPFTVTIGQAVYPSWEKIYALIQQKVKNFVPLDATRLAKEAGNVMAVNMVLLGALLKTRILPLRPERVKETITLRTGAHAGTNLRAFELGFLAVNNF